MNRDTLAQSIEEARRFLRLAKALEADAGKDEFYLRYTRDDFGTASKKTGAVKRASMDLSRALSNLRRPG